jgi:hypothetical protein
MGTGKAGFESLCDNFVLLAVAALFERRSHGNSKTAVTGRRYKRRFSHRLLSLAGTADQI